MIRELFLDTIVRIKSGCGRTALIWDLGNYAIVAVPKRASAPSVAILSSRETAIEFAEKRLEADNSD